MEKNTREKFLAVVLSLLGFNVLFFTFMPQVPGIPFPPMFGTLGFALFINIASFIVYLSFKPELKRNYLIFLVLSSLISIASIFRASMIDTFLLSGLSIFLFFTGLISILSRRIPESVSDFISFPILLFMRWVMEFTKTQGLAKSQISSFKKGMTFWKSIHGDTLTSILRGVVITVPIALVIIFLLGSADPVFLTKVKSIVTFNWNEFPYWIIGRSIFSYIFVLIAISVLYLKSEELKTPKEKTRDYTLETIILTSTIAVILLGFLIIQFKYLFTSVSETELIQFGVKTYSEYVRRGFSELLLVSGIVYLVSTFALGALQTSKRVFLKISTSVLLSELIIFIFSIFRRVYLYQLEHGFTRIRVYGSGFLIILGILTLILILKLFIKNKSWLWIETSIAVIGVILLSFLNVDRLVSQYFPPTVNGEVDYVYISKLSPDSVDGWIKAYNHAEDTGKRLLLLSRNFTEEEKRQIMYSYWVSFYVQRNYRNLAQKYETYNGYFDLRKLNIAEYFAYKRLKESIRQERVLDQVIVLESKFMSVDPNLRFRDFDRDMNSPLIW